MSKILSKYAQANNLTVEYTSQQDYMNALAANQSPKTPADSITPYTFQEWYGRNVGIIPGEEYLQYNEYLKNWYRNRYTSDDVLSNVRQDYITLLKQLSLVFKDEFDDTWMSDINFDDNLELEDAIPFFARKLKEIAIYLVNKRSAIKKAKLKYNMTGAYNALERLFYEYLLKAFTKRDYVLNIPEQSAWNVFPDLSAVNNQFQIVVQELYDDTSYFDKDPKIPVSAYFNLDQLAVSSYYIDTLNFQESAIDWLFSTGITPIYADNPLIWTLSEMLAEYGVSTTSQLPYSAFESADKKILNVYNQIKLTQKYLGEDQYYISGGYYTIKTKDFNYEFKQGNNWFFWPSGEYVQEIESDNWDPISLTATSLIDIASGSDNYKYADKIFVTNNNITSGAWLKQTTQNTITRIMSAVADASDMLRFRFPYPGYGISGEGLDWSGPQLDNLDPAFSYLDKDEQNTILDNYWTATFPASTFKPISLHDTNIIDNGGHADHYYQDADKILIRLASNTDKIHDSNPNSVYQDEFDRAWLYKVTKTDIPVKTEKNFIYWPLFRYEQGDTLPLNIISSQCIPMALSSINVRNDIIGCRAGYGLYDSDIVYKLDSRDGYAIECAFLSGFDLRTQVPGASGKLQTSLSLNCKPGSYETFIWQDTATYINNTNIIHKEHQLGCSYISTTHNSIFNNRSKAVAELDENGMGNYLDCDCKAIWYSPIGHPGNSYEEYDGMADIIFTNTQFPSAFDIQTWLGTDGLPYNQSKDFAWFQLTGTNLETDVGWGRGSWKAGNGTYNFQLSSGIQYKYLRSNLKRTPSELFLKAVPEIIVKQAYNSTPLPKWIKGSLQQDGTWAKTETESPMVINPGDYLLYDHSTSNWYCLTSIGDYGYSHTYSASALIPSPWSNYTYATLGKKIITYWPSNTYDNAPTILAPELTSVDWQVLDPSGNYMYSYEANPSTPFTIQLDIVGTYQIEATGYAPTRLYKTTTNHIPWITSVNKSLTITPSGALEITTIYNDQLNIIWNTPLTGWDYSTDTYNALASGGRPFWGKAYDDNSINTKNKGTSVLGRGIRPAGYDNYSYLTQPEPATISLSSDCYVEYEYTGDNSIIWTQPLNFTVEDIKKQWNKLIINNNVVSPLSSYLYTINQETIISATDAESDLVLYKDSITDQWVNYWAMEPFTWTQKLTDSSIGVPPTGGTWVPLSTGSLVDTYIPCANLTNRHFPTIASIPDVGGLYSTEDSGGYFIPKLLGISTYVGKNYTNKLETAKLAMDNRGLSGIIQNTELYTTDRGLTQTTQLNLLSTQSTDASWMKAGVTEGYKAGNIINARESQEFIPYQTRYETSQSNFNGLNTQDRSYDPWIGTEDNIWADPTRFPPNFRNEYDIDGWYADNTLPTDKFIYQWKTDIFGNQYALLKTANTNIYEKNRSFGDLWVKTTDGVISPAVCALSGIYEDFVFISSAVQTELYNNQIRNFDIWFDTIMIHLSSHILIEKFSLDYETNMIKSFSDNIIVIPLENGYHAGIWFFADDKHITICNLLSGDNYVYPKMYSLELNSNNIVVELDGINDAKAMQLTALGLTSIEDPIFTYNQLTKNYCISFLGYSPLYGSGMILNTITVNGWDSIFSIDNVTSITPLTS